MRVIRLHPNRGNAGQHCVYAVSVAVSGADRVVVARGDKTLEVEVNLVVAERVAHLYGNLYTREEGRRKASERGRGGRSGERGERAGEGSGQGTEVTTSRG